MSKTTECCIASPCGALVTIIINHNGGLPTMDAVGYSGITDDGDAVCRDHFCPTCGNFHSEAAQFERCAFEGRHDIDCTPLCSRATALAVLARYGTVQ